MTHPAHFAVTVRALIVDQDELLMVKHDPKFKYYALPGGRLETGEYTTDAVARELMEELAIKADVGNLLFVNDWVGPHDHRLELFFWINNGADFRRANTATASHGFEIADVAFGDPTDPKYHLLPSFLRKKFATIARLGNDYPTELVRSYSEQV
jgi:ADP-ribose pyrophosphatase YjhB (NUDIX family)